MKASAARTTNPINSMTANIRRGFMTKALNLLKASRIGTRLIIATAILTIIAASIFVSGFAQETERPAAPQPDLFSFGKKAVLSESEVKTTPDLADSPSEILASTPSSANYTFATNATSSLAQDLNSNVVDMTTGTTTLSSTSIDEGSSAATSIGFDFYLMGNRYSQFNVTTNGLVSLSNTSTTASGSTYVASGGTTTTPIISAFAADLGTGTSGKTHYKLIGTAPNRTLVIEFNNMTLLWTNSFTNDGTYQVRLYESTGIVEFVYGTMSITSTASASDTTVGVGFSTNTTTNNLAYVTTATNTVSTAASFTDNPIYPTGPIANLNSAANGSRRSYRFTPPVPAPPTSLTFTSITAASMTLNWADAPTEVGYAIYRSTDGVNYSFVGTAASDAVSFNATGLTPSTNYFWNVYALSEGALSTALNGSQATAAPGNITCNGAGGNWNTAGSWTGGIPTASDNVTIGSGCTITIDVTTATALNVTVQSGGILQYISTPASTLTVVQSVTIDSGGTFQSAATGTVITHSLVVGTNLTNNGTLDFSTNANTAGAVITFTGAANATFSGTGTTTDIRTLTINKGTSSASTLEITTSAFTVQGVSTDGTAAAFLTLTNGTLKVSGTFTGTFRTFTAAAYTIGATAGFWLNNPNYTVAGQNGSPTLNGLLRVSAGTYNVGTASGNSMGFGSGSTVTIEGGAVNTTGRFGVGTSTNAVTYTQNGGTVTASTIGSSSTTLASFDLGTSASSIVTFSGGTIVLQNVNSGASGPRDYRVNTNQPTFSGGTLQIGNASTATTFTFNIQGYTPNLVVNNTTNNKTAQVQATTIILGDLTLNTGTTYACNGFSTFYNGATLTNNGALTGTVSSSRFDFQGTVAQTYSGTGTFGTNAAPFLSTGVGIANTSNVTLNAPIITNRVNLFAGQFINSNQISLGTGGSAAIFVQRGGGGVASGSFDVAPTFNLGTGTYQVTYTTATTPVTTSVEIPPTRTLNFLTVNNANGVTVAGGNLSVATTLTMTVGNLITSSSNLVTVTGTTAGAVSGGSTTSFVNGPLARVLPASLATGTTYTFPVGKGSFNMFELVNPTTNAGGTVTVQAEVFDVDSGGTAGTGLTTISHNRYWQASITAGAGNFTNTLVRLTESPLSGNRVGYSTTQSGSYDSIGGTVAGNTLQSSTPSTTLGFFVMGQVTLAGGTYTVGTGGNYGTLTLAVADLNSKTITGPVILSLTDANYSASETFPLVINANSSSSATNTITIKPAPGVTSLIVGTSTSQIFDLSGIKFLTIDGSNTVGGTSQDLTIRNASTGASSSTIRLINDASNDTIKNVIVEGASTNTTGGVVHFSTGITTGNDSNTITGNTIRDRNDVTGVPTNLVYSAGTSGTITNTSNTISNNTLKNFTVNGVNLATTGNESWTISGNTIFEEVARTTALTGITLNSLGTNTITLNTIRDLNTSVGVVGILLDDAFGTTVSRNRIFSIPSTSGSTGTLLGIRYTGGSGLLTSVTLTNNQISIVPLFSNAQTVTGIEDDAFTGNVINVYFNSVLIGGTATGSTTWGLRRATSTPTTMTLRDNIFFNNRTGGAVNHYAIGEQSLGSGTFSSNYNIFVGTGTTAANFLDRGTSSTGTPMSFASWQATTGTPDLNAQASNPTGNYTVANMFTSSNDLHLSTAGTNPAIGTGNATGTSVNNDFDNDLRDTVPDIGADEIVSGRSGTIPSGTYRDGVIGSAGLAGDTTFTGSLTLTGIVDANNFTLTSDCGATVTGGGPGSFVTNGNVKKNFCVGSTFIFPVGTVSGYSPLDTDITAVFSPNSSLTVRVDAGTAPASPSLNSSTTLQRYWTLTEGGSIQSNLLFHYIDPTDIMGNENAYEVIKIETNTAVHIPFPNAVVSPAANTAAVNNVTSFSKWTLGEPLAPTNITANISGHVLSNGQPLAGVTMTLLDTVLVQNRTTVTGADGSYHFDAMLTGRDFVVSPARFGYNFNPQSRAFTHIGEINTVDFAGTPDASQHQVNNDFDADGQTDLTVFRPADGTWYTLLSSNGTYKTDQWGADGDRIVPADYDGDGKTDLAVFRPSNGTWYIYQSTTNSLRAVQWGISTDVVTPADYDGDGRADIAVWRGSTGTWYILESITGNLRAVNWGTTGDKPVMADYDHDGKADIAVWRPSNATWYIIQSSNNQNRYEHWGIETDRPVVGDYDGDGKADLAVFRGETGTWYVKQSTDGSTSARTHGTSADVLAPADYDGDGKTDRAVWQSQNGTWLILRSGSNSVSNQQWGANGDVPAPSAYVP